jgi:hypothetical protein
MGLDVHINTKTVPTMYSMTTDTAAAGKVVKHNSTSDTQEVSDILIPPGVMQTKLLVHALFTYNTRMILYQF